MDKRGKFLSMVLMLVLCVSHHSVAQDPTQEPKPVQCQPCIHDYLYVQCPGDQCPLLFERTDTATTCPMSDTNTTAEGNSTTESTASVEADITTSATTVVSTQAASPNQYVTSSFSNNTDEVTPAPPPPPTHTKTPPTHLCRLCNGNSKEGGGEGDCLECNKEREQRGDSAVEVFRCVLKKKDEGDDSGVDIVIIIASASAGGGALLVVVVVVACVCCCRRRRRRLARRKDREEQGPGMVFDHDMTTTTQQQREEKEGDTCVKEEEVQRRPNKPGVEVPDYVNLASTMPRPISIERGHDKVTRYVRDPTVKEPEPTPPGALADGDADEEELAKLPDAPLPPPGARKRSTDVGVSHVPLHHIRTRHTEQSRHAPKSRAGRSGAASTLPGYAAYAAASGSDPYLPKFPMEEALEQQQQEEEQRASGGKRKVSKPDTTAAAPREAAEVGMTKRDDEEPELDYVNMLGPGAEAKFGVTPTGDAASTKGSGEEEAEGAKGVINPGLQMDDEEPEDDYANQAAIQEALHVDENPYQNLPFRGAR